MFCVSCFIQSLLAFRRACLRACPSAGHVYSGVVLQGSLGGPRASSGWLGGSWALLGVYLEVLGESSDVLGRSLDVPLDVPWDVFGGPLGSLGRFSGSPRGSLGGLGGTKNRRGFFGASPEGPGELFVWFDALEWSLGRSWEVKMLFHGH